MRILYAVATASAVAPGIAQADPPAAPAAAAAAKPATSTGDEDGCGNTQATTVGFGPRGHGICIFAGALTVGFSLTGMATGDAHGQTSHELASIIMPAVGFRMPLHNDLALDLGFLTTLSNVLGSNSTDFPIAASGTADSSCSLSPTHFVSNLPCVGNGTLRPYAAAYLALTVLQGKNAALATLGPMMGAARTTDDPTVHFYGGVMLTFASAYFTVDLFQQTATVTKNAAADAKAAAAAPAAVPAAAPAVAAAPAAGAVPAAPAIVPAAATVTTPTAVQPGVSK